MTVRVGHRVVAQLLERSTDTPSLDEWLRGLDDLPAHRDISGALVERAARDGGGVLAPAEVAGLLDRLAAMAMRRLVTTGSLLRTAWDLRDDVAATDAMYVGAARAVQGQLLTADERLARAVPDLAVPLT